MNPRELVQQMVLVAYELSCAEGHERKAAVHRREAMRMQGEVHAEFTAALEHAETLQNPEIHP